MPSHRPLTQPCTLPHGPVRSENALCLQGRNSRLKRVCRSPLCCGCDGPHVYAGLRQYGGFRPASKFNPRSIPVPLLVMPPVSRQRETVAVESRKNSLICRILIHEAESVHFCTAATPESCCSSGRSVSSIPLLPIPVRDSAFDEVIQFPWLRSGVYEKMNAFGNPCHYGTGNQRGQSISPSYVTCVTATKMTKT